VNDLGEVQQDAVDFLNTAEGLLSLENTLIHTGGEAGSRSPNGTGPRSVTSAEVLRQRPSRPPDHAAENLALIGLAQSMATVPEDILQRLADTALIHLPSAFRRPQSIGRQRPTKELPLARNRW
jgi:hypothetical protein